MGSHQVRGCVLEAQGCTYLTRERRTVPATTMRINLPLFA